jgi:lipoprotein-releasing system permease protein
MRLLAYIAIKHLLARKRQSLVSLMGIILGVAFFLAIASMMQGSENDFIKRLVDNSPHITISAQFRTPREQALEKIYKNTSTALEIASVKPLTETRGIRGYLKILEYLRGLSGVKASAVLTGQGLISFAGQEFAVTLNGMVPSEINDVTTIKNYMVKGSVDDILSNPDGIIIGETLRKNFSLSVNDIITIASNTGQVRAFRVLGIFKTGRSSYDERQVFMDIKRVQALLGRINRVDTILIKMDNPNNAREIAGTIEKEIGYKSVSWQESSEDLFNTLAIRNTIMYSVVSAVLIVAAFGIYNVISTVVMEKQKDIAILKSMGFIATDIKRIFLIQGIILGTIGCSIGLPGGVGIMAGMGNIRFKPPGGSEVINMPIDWGWKQFAIAATFAIIASVLAAYLPARKAAKVLPVDVLRGS